MIRLQIVLDQLEAETLAKWAKAELRDPRDQIRVVLREALEQKGLLQQKPSDENLMESTNIPNQVKETTS